MSAKHINTAADLVRFGASLKVTCMGCSAARTLSGIEVVKAFGVVPLWHTEERFKCSRCGEKGAKVEVLPPV